MDEYAFGFTTENTHYGPTRNPHDRERVAGAEKGWKVVSAQVSWLTRSP